MLAAALPAGTPMIMNPTYFQDFPGYDSMSLEFFQATNQSMFELQANAGRLVEVHVYAGSNSALFNSTLAAFLVAAGENAYYGAGSTWNTCDSWLIPHAEYLKPLGKPLGLASVVGGIWQRKFESGTIATVDTTHTPSKTCIVWGDGSLTGC